MLIGKLILNDKHTLSLKGYDKAGNLRLDGYTTNNFDYALFSFIDKAQVFQTASSAGLESVMDNITTHNNEKIGFYIRKKARSAQYIGDRKGFFHTIAFALKLACYGSFNNNFLAVKSKTNEVHEFTLNREDMAFYKDLAIDTLEVNISTYREQILECTIKGVCGNISFNVYFYEEKSYSEFLETYKYRTIQVGNPFEDEKVTVETIKEITKIGYDSVRGLLVDLDYLLQKKGMSYIREKKFYELNKLDEFFAYLTYLKETNRFIKADYETTGLKITSNSRYREDDRMVGLAIAVDALSEDKHALDDKYKDVRFYIPVYHTNMTNIFTNLNDSERERVLSDLDSFHYDNDKKEEIRDALMNGTEEEVNDWIMMGYLKPILETKKIVNANVAFDWKVGYIYYIDTNFVDDSQLAAQLLVHKYSDYGLKDLTYAITGRKVLSLDDFSPTGKWGDLPITFRDLPKDYVLAYAPADVDNLDLILPVLKKDITLTDQEMVYELEVATARVIGYQEFWGYNMSPDKTADLTAELMEELHNITKKIHQRAGKEFNLESPAQLLEVLRDAGYDVNSTNKETLNQLYNESDDLIANILEYRKVSQVLKLFIKPLPEQMNRNGDIYPSTFSIGARTGRMSASKPNYQQANDIIKKYIRARDGFYIVDSDLSQIEYRVTATMSGQPELLEMFKDFEKDYHTYQTSRMFKIPYELVEKNQRKQAKGINFGLPYGMGDSSLGYRIFGKRNEETKKQAAKLRKLYFEGQEKVLYFFENTRDVAVANGYSRTYFGRRRYYDFVKYAVHSIRKQAGNAVIQGTAADIFKLNIVRILHYIKKYGLWDKVRILGLIHDEVLLEVHESISPFFIQKMVRKSMEFEYKGFCPIFCGVGFGKTWYEAKSDLSEINTQMGNMLYEKADTIYWKDSKYYREYNDISALVGTEIKQYKIWYMSDYIRNTNNHNKPIRPYAYAMLEGMVRGIRVDEEIPEIVINNPSLELKTALTLNTVKNKLGLDDLLTCFINDYMESELKLEDINILDPKNAVEIKVEETVVEEEKPVEEENVLEVTEEEYIQIMGYSFDPDVLTVNLACLSMEDISKLKNYLTKKVNNDSDYVVRLVYYKDDIKSHVKSYNIRYSHAEKVVEFVRRVKIQEETISA